MSTLSILHEAVPFKKIEKNAGCFDGLEVDLQVSKDGVVYIVHDKIINGKIFVEYDSAQIDEIIAARKESDFVSQKGVRDFVVTFKEWIEYVAINFSHKNILLYFEIKGEGANTKAILEETSNLCLKFKDELKNAKIHFISFHEKQIIAFENFKKKSKGFYYETMLIFDYGKKDNSEFRADATNCKELPTPAEIKNLVGNHNLFGASLDARYLNDQGNHGRVLQLIRYGFCINIWNSGEDLAVFEKWQKFSKEQNFDFTYTHDDPKKISGSEL
jgi:glycerophosphoryl diester phosphodiesterase